MSQQSLTIEERYALLKQEFDEIDKKYNRALNDIELDFPPTLGLSKLTFTPADQQALLDIAQDYYTAHFDQKLADFVCANAQKQSQQSYKIAQNKANYKQDCQSLQDKYNCFFFVADLHSLTTAYDKTQNLAANSQAMLIDWLTAGLDPKKCTIFIRK